MSWKGWYPPDLPPEHPPFFEYVKDARGRQLCFYYHPREGHRWTNFAPEHCVHIEGEPSLVGTPIHLLDWQLGPQREMWGWKLVKNGQLTDIRRYQDVWCFVPKKNSKTTWNIVNALAMIKLDGLIQGQVYYFCETTEQAEDSGWRIARAMVQAEKGALKHEYEDFEDKIIHRPTSSRLRLVSGSSDNLDGKNVLGAVEDEFWKRKDKTALMQLRTGSVARKNTMFIHISTFGNDTTSSAYKDYERCKEIISGHKIAPRTLAIVHEAPAGADPHDKSWWHIPNPGWGQTVNADTLEQIYEESLESPTLFATFCQYHLGMWTSGSQEWLTDQQWAFCKDSFTEADLEGEVCYGGIDLASNRDMNAFALCFPKRSEKNPDEIIYRLLVWYWVCETFAKEKARNDERYQNWIKQGHLFKTKDDTVDYNVIRDFISKNLASRFNIQQIGFDRRFAQNIIFDLRDHKDHKIWKNPPRDGDPPRILQIGQGEAHMGPAVKEFERLVLRGEVRHNGHPILDWNRGNARLVKQKSGLYLLSKSSSTGKVDGLHASVMAHYLAAAAPPPKKSIYETRGVITG